MKKSVTAVAAVLALSAGVAFAQTSSATNVATKGTYSDGITDEFASGVDTKNGAIFTVLNPVDKTLGIGVGGKVGDSIWVSVVDALYYEGVTGSDSNTVTNNSSSVSTGTTITTPASSSESSSSSSTKKNNNTDGFTSAFKNGLKVAVDMNGVGGQLYWDADNTTTNGYRGIATVNGDTAAASMSGWTSLTAAQGTTTSSGSSKSTSTSISGSGKSEETTTTAVSGVVNANNNNTFGIALQNVKMDLPVGDLSLYVKLSDIQVGINDGKMFENEDNGRTTEYTTTYKRSYKNLPNDKNKTTTTGSTTTSSSETTETTTNYSGTYFSGAVTPAAKLEVGVGLPALGAVKPELKVEDQVFFGIFNNTDKTNVYYKTNTTTVTQNATDTTTVINSTDVTSSYENKYTSGTKFGFRNDAALTLSGEYATEKFNLKASAGATLVTSTLTTPASTTTKSSKKVVNKSTTYAKTTASNDGKLTTTEDSSETYGITTTKYDFIKVTPEIVVAGQCKVNKNLTVNAYVSAQPASFTWGTTTTTTTKDSSAIVSHTKNTTTTVTTTGTTSTTKVEGKETTTYNAESTTTIVTTDLTTTGSTTTGTVATAVTTPSGTITTTTTSPANSTTTTPTGTTYKDSNKASNSSATTTYKAAAGSYESQFGVTIMPTDNIVISLAENIKAYGGLSLNYLTNNSMVISAAVKF